MGAVAWSPSQAPSLAGQRIRLFALKGTEELGRAIGEKLGLTPGEVEERVFEDGEHKMRPLDSVGGCNVYVVHSLHGGPDGSVNDKLCRLLFFIGALKDAGAASVTAVTPYLCYARKDRRTKRMDPVTTRYVAALFEAVGVDCVMAIDVHNEAAFENAFRCRTVALTAAPLHVAWLGRLVGQEAVCIVSPDLGGGKRAEILRGMMETSLGRPVGMAFAEKHRSAGIVSGHLFAGDVTGATCIIVDDLISTGGTLLRAARAARDRGARQVFACATHGLFMEGAAAALAEPDIDRIIITDAVPAWRLPPGATRDKLIVTSSASLLAEAIRRLHQHESLEDLGVF